MSPEICLFVCSYYAAEVSEVLRICQYNDISVEVFPGDCSHPERMRDAVLTQLGRNPDCWIEIMGGYCLPKRTIGLPEQENIHFYTDHQCFYFLTNQSIVDHLIRQGAYLLSPGWLENWQEIIRKWGFDRDLAAQFFGESFRKLIMLDTGVAKDSSQKLLEFSEFLSLPYEILPVGLDHLRYRLAEIVGERHTQVIQEKFSRIEQKKQMEVANYALALEILSMVARNLPEDDVVNNIIELFRMLLAPKQIIYLSVRKDVPERIWSAHSQPVENETTLKERLLSLREDYQLNEAGFLLRIKHKDHTLGILEIQDVAFPEYLKTYLSLALNIANVCGLAIQNALSYQEIERAVQALEESETRLSDILDSNPDGILVLSQDSVIQYANPAASEIIGRPAKLLPGMKFEQLPLDDNYEEKVIHRGENDEVIVDIRNVQTIWDGERVSIISLRDVTEAKRIKEALTANQRLADIGTLSAGVAHELNSPLQVIIGLSSSMLTQISRPDIDLERISHNLETIRRNGWRGAEIVKSLLTYARPSANTTQMNNLNQIIQEALLLVEHQLKSWSNILIKLDLAPALPDLMCDRNQMAQILINLISNARDALPMGGEILIRTRFDESSGLINWQVKDNGKGIPDEHLERVFTPFFTTKQVGAGTGLGLSVVMGIVQAHGGKISVRSNPGKGTAVDMSFPLDWSCPTNKKDKTVDGARETFARYDE